MQAYAGSEVATGRGGPGSARMILGRFAVALVRAAGGNAHCEQFCELKSKKAQGREE